MSRLDKLQGFRGGVVYAAAGVLPATVHTWSLEIGEAPGAGHKRYSAVDAIMLGLMQSLTAEAGLPASRAARVLNAKRVEIAQAVQAIVDEQEAAERWRWDGGPYLHIRPASSRVSRSDDVANVIAEEGIGDAIADRASGSSQIILALPRNVCRILLSLENVVSGNKPASADA